MAHWELSCQKKENKTIYICSDKMCRYRDLLGYKMYQLIACAFEVTNNSTVVSYGQLTFNA